MVLPQLAGACYMIIVGACLSTLDCSRSGSSWVLDGSTTRCWDAAHRKDVLIALWSFGLYFPVATTSGVLMQPDEPK